MAGKRTNQYDIDPGSPANTDNHDGAHDENLRNADKAKVAQTRVDKQESLIPQRGKNPALAELQAKREARRAEQAPPAEARADDAERTE